MGRAVVVWRLVRGDLHRRPVHSMLLVILIAATAATLTIGLGLGDFARTPFARARAATRGPDLVAEIQSGQGATTVPERTFVALAHAPGVAGTAGPFAVAYVRLTVGEQVSRSTPKLAPRSSQQSTGRC